MKSNISLETLGVLLLTMTLVVAPVAWAQSKYKTLYRFNGADGSQPDAGLTLDQAGNLYGMTRDGGAYGYGTVFKLNRNADGSWSEHVLFSFTGGADGSSPFASVIVDAAGNLYGTTSAGEATLPESRTSSSMKRGGGRRACCIPSPGAATAAVRSLG